MPAAPKSNGSRFETARRRLLANLIRMPERELLTARMQISMFTWPEVIAIFEMRRRYRLPAATTFEFRLQRLGQRLGRRLDLIVERFPTLWRL